MAESVALVHDFLVKLGGAERVLKALADMYPKAPIYTLLYDEKKTGSIFPKERVRPSRLQNFPAALRNRQRYLLPLMPNAIESLNLSDFDVVISSSSAFAHAVNTAPKARHIAYFHSPMRYAWDWFHEYKREQGVGKIRSAAISLLLHRIRQWDRVASDRSDIAIANSRNVAGRIAKYYKREASVIYPPVDISRFHVSKNHENYFLIVSTLTPYKRIDVAIELFNRIGRKLVIIGDGAHRNYLEKIASDNIEFLGFKSDAEIVEYVKYCRAFLFPGEDDFGIAPVEAMACGKPVLAFGRGGAMETIVPGISGEFFYEPNAASMEEGLARLLQNEDSYKPHTIRKHTEKFAPDLFVNKMRKIVRA